MAMRIMENWRRFFFRHSLMQSDGVAMRNFTWSRVSLTSAEHGLADIVSVVVP
jgi:hypothetical protein